MKKLILASAASIVGLTSLAGIAGAATNDNPMSSLVDRIATKFNLNKDEVKAVFEEERSAHQAERETKVGEALKAAGFSDAQISAWSEKMKTQRDEMKAWHDNNQDATPAERKAHMVQEKTDMEAWAKDQGIDLEKLRTALKDAGVHGPGFGRGPRGGMGHAMMENAPDDAPAN